MALVLADRIKETTSTTGTGTYTLAGAENGFEAFSVIGNSNTTYYCCTDGVDFEIGLGTYTLSGTTLARTTVLQSSNDDDEVVWTNGLRTIFCTQPAEKAVFLDATGNMPITNSASVGGSLTVTGDGTFGGTIGVTGVLTGTSLDISGNIDVDGITNLDVVDIDGAVDMASTLAVAGVVTANAGVVVDNITIDGTQIDLSSGDLTLDVAGDIILDAGGQNIVFKDDGTEFGQIYQSSNHLHLFSSISDADIKIQGNDGGATITAVLFDMSDGGTAIFNKNADFVDGSGVRLGAGNDLQLYHDGSNSYIDETGTGSLIIKSNRTRIQSDGGENQIEALANGAVELYFDTSKKIATANTGVNVTGGIGLGGTGAANILNDYEEGTFVPTFKNSGGVEVDAYSIQTGFYTKVGRLVHVRGFVVVNGISALGSTNPIFLGGLPFDSENVTNGHSVGTFNYGQGLNITAGHVCAGHLGNNTTNVNLTIWNTSTGVGDFTFGLLSADGGIMFSIHYHVA